MRINGTLQNTSYFPLFTTLQVRCKICVVLDVCVVLDSVKLYLLSGLLEPQAFPRY